VSTPDHVRRIGELRKMARILVTIGACATSGGIQALRNWADHDAYRAAVYPTPEFVESLARSTAIAEHVPVDFELRGCPISPDQLWSSSRPSSPAAGRSSATRRSAWSASDGASCAS
jgi:coenzyme F420-reducing hydrogenase gamma subunit